MAGQRDVGPAGGRAALPGWLAVGVRDAAERLHQPWVGVSWEGFVIGQVVELLAARGLSVAPPYFRTSDGYEVERVFTLHRQLGAIAEKLTSHPAQADCALQRRR